MTNAAADPHFCSPPLTALRLRTHGPVTFRCQCGRRWHIEHFYAERDGRYLGSSWVLEGPRNLMPESRPALDEDRLRA
jgi:hypothetical protein